MGDEAFLPVMNKSQNKDEKGKIDIAERFSEQSKSEKSDCDVDSENKNNFNDDNDNNEDDDDDDLMEENLKDLELSLTEEEKRNFKENNFSLALHSYTEGLRICPLSFPRDRSILYSNRAATKAKLDKKKDAIK